MKTRIKSTLCFIIMFLILSTCFTSFIYSAIKEPLEKQINFPIKEETLLDKDLILEENKRPLIGPVIDVGELKDSTLENEQENPSENPSGVLPSEYCMRDEYIIFAQHQDKSGYCWNFASTMAMATAIMKATNEYYDFSELWVGLSAFNTLSGYSQIGGGGTLNTHYDAIKKSGIMLESDLPFVNSHIMTNENAESYYNFYNKQSNDDLTDCISYKSYSRKKIDDIKAHIIENGSMYMAFSFKTGFVEDGDDVYYLPPNQKNTNSAHAVSVIGWDDNFQRELYLNGAETPTVFKGAWIILNSYTEDSGTDGISFVFYDDNNISSVYGYNYEQDTTKDLYFYDKIENGYAYPTFVKGKYYGDFTAENGETKQKNIFYDDVNLEYSYIASEGTSIKDINIYLNGQNVTKDFTVNIDSNAKRFYISKEKAEYGHYKVLVDYGNGEKTDTYLNNFFVTYGLVGEELEYNYESNDFGFNMGPDLELYSYILPDKNFIIYTSYLNGVVSFTQRAEPSVYSEENMSVPNISYQIVDGKSALVQHVIESKTGYKLVYNFNFEYNENTALQPVYVYYDLGGGTNSSKNYNIELANETSDLVLYEPTREGYTFSGWYLDYGNSSREIKKDGDAYYIDWDDIIHMGESPTLYGSSYYKKYYNNSSVVFVYAHWEEVDYYNVDLTINGNGKTQIGEHVSISSEDSLRYIFTPNSDWCLSGVKINGTDVSQKELVEIIKNGLILENIENDISIEATFSEGAYVSLNFGENIKNAYLTKVYNGETVKFYNGDIVPSKYLNTMYANYFDLVVEVFDDTEDTTFVLDGVGNYDALEKGVFKKSTSIYKNAKIKEISVGSATPKPKQSVTVRYTPFSLLLEGHYLSIDKNALEGEKSSGVYTAGEVVYLFVKIPIDTIEYRYYLPASFENIGEQWYRKAIYVNADQPNLGNINVYRALKEYEIVWKDWDGTEIYSEYYYYGDELYYDDGGSERHPVRADDEKYTYKFVGWTPSLEQVKGNATYQAVYSATPKQFNINLEVSEGGTVSSVSETDSLTYFDSLTYLITPKEGYKIKDVSVNGASLGAVSSYTFKEVIADQILHVEFEKITYTIDVTCQDNGTCDLSGINKVDYASSIKVNVIPNVGYKVKDFIVDGVSYGNISSYTFTSVLCNHTVRIELEKIKHTVNILCGDNGKADIVGIKEVEYGSDISVKITPNENYTIDFVKINGVLAELSNSLLTVNVKNDMLIEIAFKQDVFEITTSSTANGTVTPSASIKVGESYTVNFAPITGYKIKDVKIDDVSMGKISGYTFVGIDKDHTVSVEFEPLTLNVIVSVNGKGSVSADKSLVDIPYGENIALTFKAEDGWLIDSVFVDGQRVTLEDDKLIIEGITSDVEILLSCKEKESSAPIVISVGFIFLVAMASTSLLTSSLIKARKPKIKIPGVNPKKK